MIGSPPRSRIRAELRRRTAILIRLVSMALTIACFACAPANKEASTTQNDTSVTATSSAETSAPPADTPEPATKAKENPPMTDYKDKVAELHTSAGEIDIRSFPDVA